MIQDPDLALHAFVFIKRNLIFLPQKLIVGHSYRGGSSLLTQLLFRNFGFDPFIQKSKLPIQIFRDTVFNTKLNQRATAQSFESWLKSPRFTRVKFVRCPYRRAVSSYIYMLSQESNPQNITGGLESDFPHIKKTDYPELSFLQFLEGLSKINLYAYSANNHYCLQFLHGETELFHYNSYYKLENLEEAIQDLNQKKNLDIKLNLRSEQSKLKDHHLKFRDDIEECVGEWPFKELYKFSDEKTLFPHYRYFYNEKTRKLVELLYDIDIRLYGYSFTPDEW